MPRIAFIISLLITGHIIGCAKSFATESYELKGVVYSAEDKLAVPFAFVDINEIGLHSVCDNDGRFSFPKLAEGEYIVSISSLGYSQKNVSIKVPQEHTAKIFLNTESIALEELQVMAKRTAIDKLTIDRTAIEYIQPTSINDVFLLLPGNLYSKSTSGGFTQISSRQVGSDANSSLGMAVSADGAPQTNDGMRTQLIGITENSSDGGSDGEVARRTGMNKGIDTRSISTDHIGSIDIVRGISSAKHGNLSSGMISIKSKQGVSPLTLRAKADLNNKLFYIGKGFRVGEKGGTLHLGLDYLHSVDDIRDEMDKYQRLTFQSFYNLHKSVGHSTLDLSAKINQTITLNKMREDELTKEYNELYEANYKKTALTLKSEFTFKQLSWIDKFTFTANQDFVFDRITRHKMVLSSSGPRSMPIATEEGEHEGIYLPAKYYSDYYLDNKPFNLFMLADAESNIQINKRNLLKVNYGADYRRTKNFGDGAVIEDATRPPFPYDNTYMRPRPNYEIPAIISGAAFVQTEYIVNTSEKQILKLSPGVRFTKMFGLSSDYYLSKHGMTEPRINCSYSFTGKARHSIRIGYGEENKLPTMDYLYPEKVYKDYYVLNAYTNEEQFRHLITTTKIYETANKNLKANKNSKAEIGYDLTIKDFMLSATLFYEKSTTGFEYMKIYVPFTYDRYLYLKEGADISGRIPQKDDYEKVEYSLFTTMSNVENSKKTVKKGVEYRIILPKAKPINTGVEINGAYYHTRYGTSLEQYYYPDVTIADKRYPYVGVYDIDPENVYCRFNSNIWINTHIPSYRLIFTNFFQFVWHNTSQYEDRHWKYPKEYIDFKGARHSISQKDIARMDDNTDIMYYLKKSNLPIKYAIDSKPISMIWNVKATKEFASSMVRLSFYANKLLDISPVYVSGGRKTTREWTAPDFGLELSLNLNSNKKR